MTRNANNNNGTPATATAAAATPTAAPRKGATPTARLALVWGTAGRPSADRAEIVASVNAQLAAALATVKRPTPATVPAGSSQRVRAAVAADNAAAMAAYNLLRSLRISQ